MSEILQQQLKDVGSKLASPPSNKEALVKLVKQAATCLSELEQSPSVSVLESMQPFLDAVVKPELLKHQDRDIKLLVATCICEITRITAPEAPYSDDVLKDIFHLIIGTFAGLKDTSSPSFGRRIVILETVAKYRSCVVMLDLECDDLVKKMFRTLFAVASDDHAESVLTSMQTIMVALLEESEEIGEGLLFVLLSILGRNRSDISAAARRLAMNVIQQCAGNLEAGIKQFLISSISGDNRSSNSEIDYHEVIYDIYPCAPQILSAVVPYLTGELLTDQLETRSKVVKLVGDLFSLPGSAISEAFQPIFSEFLKRLADRVVGVRMSVLEHVKSCLLSNPFRAEAPQIIDALCDRLLDYDENVRKQVVAVICDVACSALSSIPVETIKLIAERLRDKSLLVKKYTMEMLAQIYKLYCVKCSDGSVKPGEFDWIPGKILRCFYDKDLRSDSIEYVLSGSLFPTGFPVKAIVGHWVRVYSGFDRVEVKALEKILEQKQRLQQEMLRYLSLRKMSQDCNVPEIPKKIMICFRIMSRTFSDPAKTEENFQILDQLKDVNIWKILTRLLDPNTSTRQSRSYRDGLLNILGEKHRLYDFLGTLSVKCSYLFFSKEHVKELLLEVDVHKSAGNEQYILSCMNILVILASFSPLLLSGVEEKLVNFLKDDNEMIKEGVLQVLAKAGGTIREQLAVPSSSLGLILERLCLEGSRKQAKYAVHALAAITEDDGLKSLSVLYKRLVDNLEEKTHLPAVLQSLGCIAQIAMAVFETRESEIGDFIESKILNCSANPEDNKKTLWEDRSEICMLKIYGIKTLVKSYLPEKDAHLRPRIDSLLEILRNILSRGEYSQDVESSSVDKSHLRLASAKGVLRLARHWDHKIPIDMFHLTLRTSEISFPQARKLFLSKVYQYIKDRLLDAKYAVAFLLNIIGLSPTEFEEEKHNLADIIQICHQARARQSSVNTDASTPMAYPEYILPYLVHVIAHHSCPNVDECKDVKKFELIYRQLYLFISMLLHSDDDGKFSADTAKDKRNICAIVSIFKSIKCSKDVVDAEKSKNSYAVCDLGLAIIKRLSRKEDNLQDMNSLISLPPALYKSSGDKEKNDCKATEEITAIEGNTTGEEGKTANEVHSADEGKTASEGQNVDEGKIASETPTGEKGKRADEVHSADEGKTASERQNVDEGKIASETPTGEEGKMADEGKTASEGQTVDEGKIASETPTGEEEKMADEVHSVDEGQNVDEGKIASEAQTWLADKSVLTHFESLNFQANGLVQPEVTEDDILKDSDNEIPLWKIIEHLKSKGPKARKGMKSESKKAGSDVNILKMAREINYDDREKSSKLLSNGNKHSPNRKSKKKPKRQKRKGSSDVVNVSVPKRRKSSSSQSAIMSQKHTSKSPSRVTKDDSQQPKTSSFQSQEQDADSEDILFESVDSDLVSSDPQSTSSKRKDKQSEQHQSGKSRKVAETGDHDSEKSNVLMETDKINRNSNSKSPLGSGKKRKRRSIAGLAMCSFKEGERDLSDLMGCRIKVWWPMDKKFYDGTVKSYDPIKRKHVVLYNDGDIEVLCLEKERWELVNNGLKSGKKLKLSKSSPHSKVSPGAGQKSKISDSSLQNKKSSKQVKRKRTPTKNVKRRHKKVSGSKLIDADSKETSDVSNAEPTWMSKVDSMNSGDSEAEIVDENATDNEESDKEVNSVSRGKSEDLVTRWNHTDESDEEKPDSEGRDIDEEGSASQKTKNCEEENADTFSEREENSDSEENQKDQEEKNVSCEGNQETDVPSFQENPSDAEISDDEPLSVWKNRAGKSSSK